MVDFEVVSKQIAMDEVGEARAVLPYGGFLAACFRLLA
jgi:hypothetical protein